MVRAAGCRAEGVSFYGDVRVRDVRPRLAGPLRGTSLSCAQGSVTAAAPQIALDLSLSEDMKSWQGRDRKSTRLNSQSLMCISYAVFCLTKKLNCRNTYSCTM